ncbi:hypothetical protein RF11_07388 [Thelohanellus kitauei]|uniref:Uncharacterized protein n=1 Tax=Thelohanellus kitauei TaxID=669202 RepID=A0A0C2MPX2_THEKT|nr:hypothetical protein RF11_07388 [Thelohanellus kitauei]
MSEMNSLLIRNFHLSGGGSIQGDLRYYGPTLNPSIREVVCDIIVLTSNLYIRKPISPHRASGVPLDFKLRLNESDFGFAFLAAACLNRSEVPTKLAALGYTASVSLCLKAAKTNAGTLARANNQGGSPSSLNSSRSSRFKDVLVV